MCPSLVFNGENDLNFHDVDFAMYFYNSFHKCIIYSKNILTKVKCTFIDNHKQPVYILNM